jgi:hypothetical protein
MGMDSKTVLKVGQTIPCPIINHPAVPGLENTPIHAILCNRPSFLAAVHRNLPFPDSPNKTGNLTDK